MMYFIMAISKTSTIFARKEPNRLGSFLIQLKLRSIRLNNTLLDRLLLNRTVRKQFNNTMLLLLYPFDPLNRFIGFKYSLFNLLLLNFDITQTLIHGLLFDFHQLLFDFH